MPHKVTWTAPAPQPPGRGRTEEGEGRPRGPSYLVLIKASQLLRAHVFVTSHDHPNTKRPLGSDSPRQGAETPAPARKGWGKTGLAIREEPSSAQRACVSASATLPPPTAQAQSPLLPAHRGRVARQLMRSAPDCLRSPISVEGAALSPAFQVSSSLHSLVEIGELR